MPYEPPFVRMQDVFDKAHPRRSPLIRHFSARTDLLLLPQVLSRAYAVHVHIALCSSQADGPRSALLARLAIHEVCKYYDTMGMCATVLGETRG